MLVSHMYEHVCVHISIPGTRCFVVVVVVAAAVVVVVVFTLLLTR